MDKVLEKRARVEATQRALMLATEQYQNALADYESELEAVGAAVAAAQREFDATMTRVEQELAKQEKQVITFNVGGTSFSTRVETLARFPDSFFAAYASGKWDASKEMFIDRDPAVFHYIMVHLRGGDIDLFYLDRRTKAALVEAADYFQLTELAKTIRDHDNRMMEAATVKKGDSTALPSGVFYTRF